MDEEVLQEIERMRKAALLCYVPLYKAGKNQLKNKVQKYNARSLYKHFNEIKT